MTIIEKHNIHSPWLFRTRPLQTNETKSTREVVPSETVAESSHNNTTMQQMQRHQYQKQQEPSKLQPYPQQQLQNLSQIDSRTARAAGGPFPLDPKRVVKSSTAPNLHVSHSLSEVFRVI